MHCTRVSLKLVYICNPLLTTLGQKRQKKTKENHNDVKNRMWSWSTHVSSFNAAESIGNLNDAKWSWPSVRMRHLGSGTSLVGVFYNICEVIHEWHLECEVCSTSSSHGSTSPEAGCTQQYKNKFSAKLWSCNPQYKRHHGDWLF